MDLKIFENLDLMELAKEFLDSDMLDKIKEGGFDKDMIMGMLEKVPNIEALIKDKLPDGAANLCDIVGDVIQSDAADAVLDKIGDMFKK